MPDHDVDVTFIGHFAKDRNVYLGQAEIASGGSVYYGALALAHLGWRVAIVTMLHPRDEHRLDELRREGIRVFARPAPATSGIENVYSTADMDRRTCRPLAFAGPFIPSDIPAITSSIWLVGPIIAGEVDLPFLRLLRVHADRHGGRVALDIQGFVRVPEGNDLAFRDWADKETGLALVDALKTDAAEAESLTGQADLRAAATELSGYGPQEIVLTRSAGLLVCAAGHFYEAPFTPRRLLGRTGRGDTSFSSYLAHRLSAPPGAACRFAAAVTSLKLEQPGPFAGTLQEVQAYAASS